MNNKHNYRNLILWQKAIDLCVEIYKLTAKFPVEERYGLVSQMRRSAVSIPSNIAEGAGRNSNKEFIHFLAIAKGSSNELETQLTVSQKLGFVSDTELESTLIRIDEVQKMNFSLQQKLMV